MRRFRRDEGVASVEFAFLLPVLLLLSIVAAEFGFAFVDWLAVSNATRTGVRVAASGGSDADTDDAVLAAITDAITGAPRAEITSVEIFEVLIDGSQGPTQGYPFSGGAPSGGCSPCGYPPASRGDEFGNLDQLGLRINFDHAWAIGFWATSDAQWSDDASIRIEPEFGT